MTLTSMYPHLRGAVPALALILAAACGGVAPPDAPDTSPPSVAALRLANLPDSMVVGGQVTVEATLTDPSGDPITGQFIWFRSSNTSVATIAPMWIGAAQVTAVGAGSTQISVGTGSSLQRSFRLKVLP